MSAKDPVLEVVCDGPSCWHYLFAPVLTGDALNEWLTGQAWIVDGDKHYCSAFCQHCARPA